MTTPELIADILTAINNPPDVASIRSRPDAQLDAALARCAQLRILLSRLLPEGADHRASEILRLRGFGPDQLVRDEAERIGVEPTSVSICDGFVWNALARELARAQTPRGTRYCPGCAGEEAPHDDRCSAAAPGIAHTTP